MPCGDVGSGLLAQEHDLGGYRPSRARPRRCWRRLDTQGPDPARDDVLQEVAVVAGDLDDEGVPSEAAAARRRRRRSRSACSTHESRVGREVGVVAEDVLRRDVGGQLDEQAVRADPHVQRIERLGLVELLGGQVALARRGHAEVDEGTSQKRPAQNAQHGYVITVSPSM